MTPHQARKLFEEMSQVEKERVLKIHKAMKKIEENYKYNFSQQKKEGKEGGC